MGTKSIAALAAMLLSASLATAQLPTAVGFESGEGFSLGSLDGQEGWSVDAGSAVVTDAASPGPPGNQGSRYVFQAESSEGSGSLVDLGVDGTGASRVLVGCWFYGEGSAVISAPASTAGVSVYMAYQALDANTFGVRTWQTDEYVAPDPDIPFSNSAWHYVVTNVRYTGAGEKTYDVKVDGIPVFANAPFLDDTEAVLEGFRSYTTESTRFDGLRVESSSDGNFDGDSLADDQEMLVAGRDPFTPDDGLGSTVTVGSGNALCEGQIEISISLADGSSVSAFGATLNYDSACLTYVSTEAGGATDDWSAVAGNGSTAGEVVIGGFRGAGTTVDDGELAVVTFACKPGSCGCTTQLTLTDLVDGLAAATTVDGTAQCFVPVPEIAVADGVTNIPDNSGPVAFGTATRGSAALSKTFTVSNTGTGTLTTGTPSVPAGYSISESLSASIPAGGNDTFTVQLSTATAGTFAGSISFANNDADENPFNFSVTGTVTAPEIAVADGVTNIPDGGGPVNFGSTTRGSAPLSKTFTVSNTGDAPLTTGTPTLPAGYSISESLSANIPAGGSDSFTVQLATATAGTFAGSISFSNNDADENPFNFSVAGTVTAPEIAVADGVTNIPDGGGPVAFGTTTRGSAPLSKTFTVSNTGDAPLTTGTPSLPAGYSISESLSASIPSGGSDTFTVQLAATNPGTFAGTVSFSNNDADENPFDFSVTGTVTAPEIAVADGATNIPDGGGPVAFGTALQGSPALEKTFTVSNTGDAALTTGTPTLPAGYSVSKPLAANIPAGGSDTFTVQLAATNPGTFAGTVSFANNDADENPFDFSVTGTITAPEIAVADGATNIPDGGGPVNFGSTTQGSPALSKTFTVSNTGDAPMATLPPTVPAGYTLAESLSASLPPGGSDTFTVELATATLGTFSGEISFANSDADENPFNFSVTGTVTATPEPEIAVSVGDSPIESGGGPVDFGTAVLGTTPPTVTFAVANGGTAALTTNAPTLPAGYSLVEALAANIPAGGSDTFTVALSTAAVGTFAGTISFANNDADENPFDIPVTGEVVPGSADTVAVGSGAAFCGGTIDIPVSVGGAAGLAAFGAVLNYDESCLDYVSTVAGAATASWATVEGDGATPGQVVLGGFRGAGAFVNGAAEIAVVRFACKSGACACTSALTLSDLADDIAGATATPGEAQCAVEPVVPGDVFAIE